MATVTDRVVQASLKLVLEPIFEADFLPCSYGFRPEHRTHDAVAEVRYLTTRSYERVVEGDIKVQTRQVLENLSRVMAADGLGFGDVVKCVVFLTDMANFAAVNEVYAEHMVEPYPARSCIQVAGLPLGAPVEIEAVAVAKS